MFYHGFEEGVRAFAVEHYGKFSQEDLTKGGFEATSAETEKRYFHFDGMGNVCVVSTSEDPAALSDKAKVLFKRMQLLFRRLSNELTLRGIDIHDHRALASTFSRHPNLAKIDSKKRDFVYRAGSGAVSTALVTQALGGLAPIEILQAVIGGVGKEIEIAVSQSQSDQAIAHLMFVVSDLLPFPTVTISLFGVTASEVENSAGLDCLKASSIDISFNYSQDSWMFLDPEVIDEDETGASLDLLATSLAQSSDEAVAAEELRVAGDEPPSADPPLPVVAAALEKVSTTEDIGTEPEPDTDPLDIFAPVADLSAVSWPRHDENAPDYAYLADIITSQTTEVTGKTLRKLIASNRYTPFSDNGIIAFALRGATLVDGDDVENARSIPIEVTRPDHRNFNCLVGFYFPDSDRLSLYTGSTVPCRLAIKSYAAGGDAANMLPTGLYSYYIWRHKNLRPALRLASGNASSAQLEAGASATVLRSKNDTVMGTKDIFDLSRPLDNVHCSYFIAEDARLGARFSSWGCLTVRGTKQGTHQWAKFQAVLSGLGSGTRLDLVLATGKDAAVANDDRHGDHLIALRQGSRGDEVERVQGALGIPQTGYFGAHTMDRFTGVQRRGNETGGRGATATGILTPAVARDLGWDVFSPNLGS